MKSSARPVRVAGRGPVTTQAFFGGFGGGVPKANGQPMICIDCGYIYRGDFDALPRDYKCPQCNVGKNRFKVVEQAGSSYANLAAQKKANKAAAAKAKKGKGPTPESWPSRSCSRLRKRRTGRRAVDSSAVDKSLQRGLLY